jgi:serine protease Do
MPRLLSLLRVWSISVRRIAVVALCGLLVWGGDLREATAVPPNAREAKVRADKAEVEKDESWVYNDFTKATAEAQQSGKPLLVVLRCIPCEACSKFDDEVVRRNEAVRSLMDQFVCVRIVQANGLNLARFQYDYDQSFHAFLMNADGTIYGRFGTRSESKDETQDMTMQGFGRALELALEWHAVYVKDKERNHQLFAAKKGPKPLVAHPEEYPTLQGKYRSELDYQGEVVKSCIHCHQVREAERRWYRDSGKLMPENVLYPYPLPKVIGLTMNPLEAAQVKSVASDSPAARAGLKAGDKIVALNGQPLLSIADLQWVLHQFGASGAMPVKVVREDKILELTLPLDAGWRAKSDISWRATSWDLRRMTTGGILFESLTPEQRAAAQLKENTLALRAKHVGQYGEHAGAKNAGFRQGDIFVEYDGSRDALTETQLFAKNVVGHKTGDKVAAKVLREGKEVELQLPQN